MMRKLFALIMTLSLLAGTATAEGLFAGLVPTPTPTPVVEEAPSYGVMMDVKTTKEEMLTDGSTKHTYNNVGQENFNAYGVLLSERGYTLPSYEHVGNSLVTTVAKGDVQFQVTFDWKAQTLVVVYPKDVKFEKRVLKNPLAGYTTIKAGQTIRFNGFVELTIHKFGVDIWYGNPVGYLNATCKNLRNTSIYSGDVFSTGGIIPTIHYINEDSRYSWKFHVGGTDNGTVSGVINEKIDRLVTFKVRARFVEIPSDILNFRDGILAITLEKGSEKYVYYIYGGENY